jgi:hypothetical protein
MTTGNASSAEDKRQQRLQLLDDHIGQHLRASEASGELKAAPSYGRPMATTEGWDQTPDEFRLPFKILKDAGVLPPEVEAMREITALQQALAATQDAAEQRALQQRLAEKRQHLALRLERLRHSGSL